MNYAIILAAGSGKRMGTHIPKQFLDLAGRPVLAWTLTA
ncbi:MAG: 2-C-methyl-D-erythritol 4-phosphate cytidylyltransferase, partial [Gemmatimonadetes bacterium]|nr:2-C-methyl-D-erythritol 4-phosphate cytidylyltransferase [Gemmatimonadota bacterium]